MTRFGLYLDEDSMSNELVKGLRRREVSVLTANEIRPPRVEMKVQCTVPIFAQRFVIELARDVARHVAHHKAHA